MNLAKEGRKSKYCFSVPQNWFGFPAGTDEHVLGRERGGRSWWLLGSVCLEMSMFLVHKDMLGLIGQTLDMLACIIYTV